MMKTMMFKQLLMWIKFRHLWGISTGKRTEGYFYHENVGDKLLAIEGVDTSCGCISVEYSKEPVRPGMDLNLSIIYKAEHPEHFSKTVRIHCNSESSPIILTVSGNAQ